MRARRREPAPPRGGSRRWRRAPIRHDLHALVPRGRRRVCPHPPRGPQPGTGLTAIGWSRPGSPEPHLHRAVPRRRKCSLAAVPSGVQACDEPASRRSTGTTTCSSSGALNGAPVWRWGPSPPNSRTRSPRGPVQAPGPPVRIARPRGGVVFDVIEVELAVPVSKVVEICEFVRCQIVVEGTKPLGRSPPSRPEGR